jgi:rRNA maturation RNase YbeY
MTARAAGTTPNRPDDRLMNVRPQLEPCDDSDDHPPGALPAVEVHLHDAAGLLAPELARLGALAGELGQELARLGHAGEVRVRLVGDAEMAPAHERYCGVAGTTDVLTFDLADEPGGPLDADLLVCVDEARRQARARGIEVAAELMLYIAHGVLHCLGHDDHDEAGAGRMHAIEDQWLSAIGLGRVYAVPERSAEPGP